MRAISTLLLIVLLAACSDERSGSRPNLVLISIDSLRADHLGSYGYARHTSPHTDALASEGVLFEDAVSSTSWTLPAHASMFTGLPVSSHECTGPMSPLALERRTLAEALQAAGYRTAGFWAGPYLHPRFGLDQGFDDYVNCASYDFEGDPRAANRRSHRDVTGPKILASVEEWLAKELEEPFFLFVHLWDVHYDYLAPPPYDTLFDPDYEGPIDGRNVPAAAKDIAPRDLEHLIALYDAEVAWTDSQVGTILDLLAARGLDSSTAVFLTSDHGEEFFEHGEFGHRKALFTESVRVPLIARLPGRFAEGARIRGPVGVVDLAPTFLALAGAPALPDTLGRSLVPLLEAGRVPEGTEGLPASSELERDGHTWLTLQDEAWKALFDGGAEAPVGLWDLRDDPHEKTNLAGTPAAPDAAEAFERARARLRRLARRHALDRAPDTRPLPEGLEDSLRSLGYVGDDDE